MTSNFASTRVICQSSRREKKSPTRRRNGHYVSEDAFGSRGGRNHARRVASVLVAVQRADVVKLDNAAKLADNPSRGRARRRCSAAQPQARSADQQAVNLIGETVTPLHGRRKPGAPAGHGAG